MHGREGGEERNCSRHMLTVPSCVASVVDGSCSSSSSSSGTSFCKDGRKISVGDCALFKPPQASPPFIGIIRSLAVIKENNFKLGVNWLYRPTEVKLGKGILLEAAPNEIFYSFHKDEIPSASLLHPCKVSFLPKGVELPSGVSSFVCRRVYDITNKCLWWLTDEDYINERQEEVGQLLYRTRIEMHATVHPGGRSPKPMNGPTSASQIKPGSDIVQNSGSSFPSQNRGKKRERGDQGSEPVKRERCSKIDDVDSGHCKSESMLKSEIAKITEKGGLVDSEAVEKLVQLMLPERNEKKIELVGRSILAGVIAATEKFDCLSRFVQLRGLPVLDEWLQEVHKGKIGDGSGPKDSGKSVEEFLIVLLRALDKLPINLHALQMCNIGKSVNHLRTHKNLEIQRKARSLVDTWKKRVEAEMNINDAKSGSNQAVPWSARQRHPEVSHGGNRHSGGSSDVAVKGLVTQLSASKTASVKLIQGESTTKSASASPGSIKSAPLPASASINLKDGQSRNTFVGESLDQPLTTRDEKSSSSSQSHNNSQSCSSDRVKTGDFPGKEDARSSTAGSLSVNKSSSGSSRHRRSNNVLQGQAVSGVQRESGSSRCSSLHRNPASEKLSQSGLTAEKAMDVPMIEGNSHKLIVKIPNRGRSPAQSASGGSFEDPSNMYSRASSPVLLEKDDQSDRNLKEKGDACRTILSADVNTESWQSNDFKDVLTGSDEGDGSPDTVPDEEHRRNGDESRKLVEVSKAASSSSGNELKSGKMQEASFSSINALIESCAYSPANNTSVSAGDDVGMNLLASVAAGEITKSDFASPTGSPCRITQLIEHSSTGNDSTMISSPGDDVTRDQTQSNDGANVDNEEQGVVSGTLLPKDGTNKTACMVSDQKPADEINRHINSSGMELQQSAAPPLKSDVKSNETKVTSVAVSPANTVMSGNKAMDCGRGKQLREKKAVVGVDVDGIPETKLSIPETKPSIPETKRRVNSSLSAEDKVNDEFSSVGVATVAIVGSSPYQSLKTEGNRTNINEVLNCGLQTEQKPPALMINSDFVDGTNQEAQVPAGSGKDSVPENGDELKTDETDSRKHVNPTEKQRSGLERNASMTAHNQVRVGPDHKGGCMEENLESKEIFEQCCGGPTAHQVSPTLPVQETEQCVKSRVSKLTENKEDETQESTADTAFVSAMRGSDMDVKVEFDLNEGLSGDDGKYGELNNSTAPGCSASVQLISPLPLPVSSVPSGLPASITVAAAAKGPFVPPDDLLRSKGELGWKGSAATSAFRPAEPRKVLEMPLGTINDIAAGKHSRPFLDIDLNVPDERIHEDMASRNSGQVMDSISELTRNRDEARGELMSSTPGRCPGGLDLDLNRVDEATDMGNYTTSIGRRLDVPKVTVRRDFDLNDGPVVDEESAEPSPFRLQARSSVPYNPPVSGLRLNNTEIGNFSPWFPPANTFSAVPFPSILPDKGEHTFPIITTGGPQRMLGPPTGATPFNTDVYRGAVLSSSPAVPFPSTPFQYPPLFPFGSSFPLPSTNFSGCSTTYIDSSSGGRVCFPAVHSQLVGPAGAASSNYQRPYVVSQPDNYGGVESTRKWGRQGLDLNAGPGGPDLEGRDEMLPLAPRQLSVTSSHALAEEQARMYQMTGGIKRKEPDGGWESYKQSSWH